MELTPSSVPNYPNAVMADCIGEFRAISRWREWAKPEMSKHIRFLVANDEADAHKNHLEIGFIRGNSSHTASDGDIIFSPDMMYYTTEVSGVRNRYKFENGKIRHEPSNCWYLVYRKLQTQSIVRYKQVRNTTQDPLLRDNAECPCCLDRLEGLLFHCPNEHQVDFKCFDNLVSPKKCPTCRSGYNLDQVSRYNATKMAKEVFTREIHFTGLMIQRERKFCGLFRVLIQYQSISDLVGAGLFYYLDERHLPLLENRGDYSVFTPALLDTTAYADFFTYLLSDRFRSTIFTNALRQCPTHTYDEADFLTHLTEQHGVGAMNILTEATRGNGDERRKLKFQTYFDFVFRRQTAEFLKDRFTAVITQCFLKPPYERMRHYDLIESEIAE